MNGISEAQALPLASSSPGKRWPAWANVALALSALVVLAVLIWQGFSSQGVPDPTKEQASSFSAFLNIGVLVFREGLECILVLSAIISSMVGAQQSHRRPVAIGAGLGSWERSLPGSSRSASSLA